VKIFMHILFSAFMLCSLAVSAGTLKAYNGSLISPSFTLQDMAGKSHNLKNYRGQVILVQFWASYCAPCRTEMPSMNNLQKKLKQKPFNILAINMAEEKADITRFVADVKPAFTILHDVDARVLQQWKVFAAPASFLLDKNGEVKFVLYGAVEWDSADIIKTITQLMK